MREASLNLTPILIYSIPQVRHENQTVRVASINSFQPRTHEQPHFARWGQTTILFSCWWKQGASRDDASVFGNWKVESNHEGVTF